MSPPTPSQNKRAAAVAVVAFAAVLALLAWALRVSPPPPSGLEGQRVQPLSLPVLASTPAVEVARRTVGQGGGAATLLHFWGPSCAPCVDEAPRIEALWRGAAGQGVVIETITADPAEDVRAMMRRLDLTFPVLHDADGAAHQTFLVHQLPMTFVLDGAGVIVRQLSGAQSAAALQGAVQEALRAGGDRGTVEGE